MGKRLWTAERVQMLAAYAENPHLSYDDISRKLTKLFGETVTIDSVDHAMRRYRIQKVQPQESYDEDEILTTQRKKKIPITKRDVNTLVRLIGDEVYANYKPIKLEAPKARKSGQGKKEEVSILDISDVHVGMINEVLDNDLGKQVVTYNHSIFLKELNTLYKSIGEIHGLLSNAYKLKKLVIHVFGDIVTNDRIFPEQIFEIEKCVGLQVWDTIPIFSQFFNDLLRFYEEIEVVCVVGNHGRSNPHHYNEPVENNFEYFVYRSWQKQFENNKKIKIIVPNTRRYIHEIMGWKHLVEHGDQLRGSSDNAIQNQLKDISLNVSGFDIMHFGHFHKLKETEIADKIIVKRNGCWIYKDEYAWNKFKTYSVPKQHFFGCNKKRPETWGYKIDLRS